MRESRTYGSVRGAHSNMRPYRDPNRLPAFGESILPRTAEADSLRCKPDPSEGSSFQDAFLSIVMPPEYKRMQDFPERLASYIAISA